MKLFILSLFAFFCCNLTQVRAADSDPEALERLYLYSSQNLNFATSLPEETILDLCRSLLPVAQREKDYQTQFRINQIMVNAYCLKGDMGFAVDLASQMYEQAKQLDFRTGIVLSLQALGNTYMYSNRYDQADEIFEEATLELHQVNDERVKVRLLLQHLYVFARSEAPDLKRAQVCLDAVAPLLEHLEESEQTRNYRFYYLNYRLRAELLSRDTSHAEQTYQALRRTEASKNLVARLKFAIASYYYQIRGDLDKALVFQDSVMRSLGHGDSNRSEYIGLLKDRANILAKMDRKAEAYDIYTRIHQLNDSLDGAKFSSQMDTLHVNYWVDQLQLEASRRANRLLTLTIALAVLALGIIVGAILVIRRQNRRLEASRCQISQESEKAAHAINSKSMFLSNMSHEIRTPLNGIVGFSQLLATCEELDDQTKKECEENIRMNSDLLMKLVNDVIDLSNLEEKQISFTYGDYDAVAICRQVTQTVITAKHDVAAIDFITTLQTLPIRTDRERLQQVFINLLVNATKFTPPQGNIRLLLEVDAQTQMAVFTVEDTGCGIPLEKQPAIFNRFEKLNEGAKGTGLGLSICQLIVEHIGGRIWIDPAYTAGARFVFTHPLNIQSPERS